VTDAYLRICLDDACCSACEQSGTIVPDCSVENPVSHSILDRVSHVPFGKLSCMKFQSIRTSVTKAKISVCFLTVAGSQVSGTLQRMWQDINGNFYLCVTQIEAGKKYEIAVRYLRYSEMMIQWRGLSFWTVEGEWIGSISRCCTRRGQYLPKVMEKSGAYGQKRPIEKYWGVRCDYFQPVKLFHHRPSAFWNFCSYFFLSSIYIYFVLPLSEW
jgi:hypothetical protein